MDSNTPLHAIAGLLVSLSDEAIEPLLVTFDALVDVGGADGRPAAAALLRETAAAAGDPARRSRLLAAADAIAAGGPCAVTAGGLSWREAAEEAGKISVEEWRVRAEAMTPVFPESPDVPVEDDDPPVILDIKLPRLPRLKVRHFFPGLVVRLRRPLIDTIGREAPVGQRLKLLAIEAEGVEAAAIYTLHFYERSFRLDVTPQDDRSVIGNGGNAWFEPIPTRDALTDLWMLVDQRLSAAEQDFDDEDDPDQLDGDMMLAIRTDLDECGDWLQGDGETPPPKPECAPVAAEYFGKDSAMATWVNLLFSAIPHCLPD